jgi:nucleotide-binding universal stress UspA family protein
MRPAQVIVGVDGSPQSNLALRWAATEAARRGSVLHVVHAFHVRGPDSAFSPEEAERAASDDGHKIVEGALRTARATAPQVSATGTSVLSGAAKALMDAAQPGDLVVVGNRGHSEFAAMVAGSTCQQVALHSPASVAVVRGRPDPAEGSVVVGYDGSAGAEGVLQAAFDVAAARGSVLTVMRAFRPSLPVWPADALPPKVYNAQTAQAAIVDELERVAQPMIEKYPGVTVHFSAPGGDPAQVLVDASHRAQLVVVGSRGHGGFTGLLLGSVGLHLLHHAHCPVLIIRS